jgi:hypothetical protein
MGAVMVEGAVDLLISGCTFTRLDSNAIMLSGYNRRVTIDHNHFEWLGQNAVASWGKSEFNDGTNGNQPRYTRMTNNWATEVGYVTLDAFSPSSLPRATPLIQPHTSMALAA